MMLSDIELRHDTCAVGNEPVVAPEFAARGSEPMRSRGSGFVQQSDQVSRRLTSKKTMKRPGRFRRIVRVAVLPGALGRAVSSGNAFGGPYRNHCRGRDPRSNRHRRRSGRLSSRKVPASGTGVVTTSSGQAPQSIALLQYRPPVHRDTWIGPASSAGAHRTQCRRAAAASTVPHSPRCRCRAKCSRARTRPSRRPSRHHHAGRSRARRRSAGCSPPVSVSVGGELDVTELPATHVPLTRAAGLARFVSKEAALVGLIAAVSTSHAPATCYSCIARRSLSLLATAIVAAVVVRSAVDLKRATCSDGLVYRSGPSSHMAYRPCKRRR